MNLKLQQDASVSMTSATSGRAWVTCSCSHLPADSIPRAGVRGEPPPQAVRKCPAEGVQGSVVASLFSQQKQPSCWLPLSIRITDLPQSSGSSYLQVMSARLQLLHVAHPHFSTTITLCQPSEAAQRVCRLGIIRNTRKQHRTPSRYLTLPNEKFLSAEVKINLPFSSVEWRLYPPDSCTQVYCNCTESPVSKDCYCCASVAERNITRIFFHVHLQHVPEKYE